MLETVSVILQVASFRLTGRRIFAMAPIHHHFERKGWSEATIVIRFWIIAAVLALIGPGHPQVAVNAMIDLSRHADKSIAVFGLGKSGISAALALQNGGAEVSAWDDDPVRRAMAEDLGVTLNDLYRTEWDAFTSLVLSPGVPLTHPAPHPLVARALITRIEIVGDMELFARSRPPGRVVGVTGTNGKSTTSALVTHLLKAAGREVQLGGNIGVPVLDLEAGSDDGIYVLELSSFQLDLIRSLVSDVAVLLNIAPDHIERHGDFPNYIASKTRIFTRRASSQTAIIGVDDDICRRIHSELAGRRGRTVVPVSAQRVIRRGVRIHDGVLIDELEGDAVEIADLASLPSLRGVHNMQNAAAAYARHPHPRGRWQGRRRCLCDLLRAGPSPGGDRRHQPRDLRQ